MVAEISKDEIKQIYQHDKSKLPAFCKEHHLSLRSILQTAALEEWDKPTPATLVPTVPAQGSPQEAYLNGMTALVTDKMLPHLQALPPEEILHQARQIERIDLIARRTLNLDNAPEPNQFNIQIIQAGANAFIRHPEAKKVLDIEAETV